LPLHNRKHKTDVLEKENKGSRRHNIIYLFIYLFNGALLMVSISWEHDCSCNDTQGDGHGLFEAAILGFA
jgi:hypothetical protein